MGAIADAIVAYAQPLLDATDGSVEEMNKAFTLSSLCYNLALLPEDRRDEAAPTRCGYRSRWGTRNSKSFGLPS